MVPSKVNKARCSASQNVRPLTACPAGSSGQACRGPDVHRAAAARSCATKGMAHLPIFRALQILRPCACSLFCMIHPGFCCSSLRCAGEGGGPLETGGAAGTRVSGQAQPPAAPGRRARLLPRKCVQPAAPAGLRGHRRSSHLPCLPQSVLQGAPDHFCHVCSPVASPPQPEQCGTAACRAALFRPMSDKHTPGRRGARGPD